jgi:ABC transport system ATP-binding/permease protein
VFPRSDAGVQHSTIKIGRLPRNDVVVDDLGASRDHAELRQLPDGQFEIVDLGSHNGTYVNGVRISRKALTEGDIVSIGHTTFRLTDGQLLRHTAQSFGH